MIFLDDESWLAPPGKMWVCLACGKHDLRRDQIGDESCFLNAELVNETTKIIITKE